MEMVLSNKIKVNVYFINSAIITFKDKLILGNKIHIYYKIPIGDKLIYSLVGNDCCLSKY